MTKPKKSPIDLSLDDPSSPHSLGPPGGRSLPLHLAYAIADHPWVDSMTIAAPGVGEGTLEKIITEQAHENGEHEVTLLRSGGTLAANLQLGADLTSISPLEANSGLSSQGMKLPLVSRICVEKEVPEAFRVHDKERV